MSVKIKINPAAIEESEEILEPYYTIMHAQTLDYFKQCKSNLKHSGKPTESVVLSVTSLENESLRQMRVDATKIKIRRKQRFVSFKGTYAGKKFSARVSFAVSPQQGELELKL